METAKGTDLPDLLEHLGYTVRRLGSRYHTTREMDSLRIKDRRTWKRYSNGKGGDAITFLQEFCGKDFRAAVNYLLEFNGKRSRDSPAPRPKPAQQEEKPAFALPIANGDQRRVFAYLQKRGIAAQVIRGFIDSGLLYEDSLHHNCVFVGKDGGGQPRFANKHGTYDLNGSGFKGDVASSDKSVAFPLPCDPALDWVAVFEAPIDLMSFCTLHPKMTSNAVALCGLYQGPLDTYLKNHPHLKNIILCLDADGPGREAAEKLTAEYEQRGYQVSVRTQELGKDWNEYLQHLVFGKEIEPSKTTNFDTKEVNKPMADLEKLIEHKTEADTQWREQRQAEREAAASLRDESVVEITRSPEAYARYLDMQGDNPGYSAGNIALMMKQGPEGATIFFTRERWKAQGRFVLDDQQDKGAKIFVRTPSGRGYTLADAFDVTQTQGREFQMLHLEDDTPEMEEALSALMKFSPVQMVVNKDLTTPAYYDPHHMMVAVNPSFSDSEAFGAIAAEIAQAKYHDRGFNREYSREGCELHAQSVAYILCRRFGIRREQPDLTRLAEQFQGWPAQDRQNVLNGIQDLSKQIGKAIEQSIAPPQRAAPTVHRDAR